MINCKNCVSVNIKHIRVFTFSNTSFELMAVYMSMSTFTIDIMNFVKTNETCSQYHFIV